MKETTALAKVKPQFDGFSASVLKIFAVITMIIDHTGVAIIAQLPGYEDKESLVYALYWIFRLIGRIAFPIYLFLMIEGLRYTKSKTKYALRLFLFCFIAEIPFDLALRGKMFDWKHQNVFFTLFLGFLVVWGFTLTREKWTEYVPKRLSKISGVILPSAYFTFRAVKYLKKNSSISINIYLLYVIIAIVTLFFVISVIQAAFKNKGERGGLKMCLDLIILSAGMLCADLLYTDYNSIGVLALAIMYAYRKDHYKRIMSGCIVLTALSSATELVSFATVPLIMNYNGKKGVGLKYLFYLVYPAHLIILYGIAKHLGLR